MDAVYNEKGEQIPDNTPVEIPIGFGHPEPLESMIARLVRAESARVQQTGEAETFEESDDFESDEGELVSPYQMHNMQEEAPLEAKGLDRSLPVTPEEKAAQQAKEAALQAEYQEFLEFKKLKAQQPPPSPEPAKQ